MMSERIFIIVPAYNEAPVVRSVVTELRTRFDYVVVIDDGSDDATAQEARAGGAEVVRHLLNRGQGAALQTGIEYALGRGAEVIVTFDADGQHRIEDVERLIAALETEKADLAIGSRFLAVSPTMPRARRILLRFATAFMRFTSGVPLTDAHNGLRALRREAAARIHITLDRMAHASEIVDQIRVLHLRVAEVPIVVHYTEYSLRKGQSGSAAFRVLFDYLIQRWFR